MCVCGVALAAAINCASVAMSDAGVEMLDLPVACSMVCVWKVGGG